MTATSETQGADPEPATRAAPADSLLGGRLASPDRPGEIWLGEASIYRPIATGDIFHDVPVPGSFEGETAHNLTMVVAHPSAMREGPILSERVQVAPVIPVDGVRRTEWTPNRFDIMPLPLLHNEASGNSFAVVKKPWAADLRLCAPVASGLLNVRRRVACLSPVGVHLLLQRLVHTDTRSAIDIRTLAGVFAPKLDEIELLQTWNEELVKHRVDVGDDLTTSLANGAADFDGFIRAARDSGQPIADLLRMDAQRGEAHRLLAAEVSRRRAILLDSLGE